MLILKADKRNAVVINSSDDAVTINALIHDKPTHTKLATKSNLIDRHTSNVNKYVWNLFKQTKLVKLVIFLKRGKIITTRFYGLTKIHELLMPLCPIESFVNSPTCNLYRFLSHFIRPTLK